MCLLVLSDWRQGGGGTCFAERSQDWVARRIIRGREGKEGGKGDWMGGEKGTKGTEESLQDPRPFSNDEINKMANSFMVAKARAGDMLLRSIDARAICGGGGGGSEAGAFLSRQSEQSQHHSRLTTCTPSIPDHTRQKLQRQKARSSSPAS